jgi:hypothetical protein
LRHDLETHEEDGHDQADEEQQNATDLHDESLFKVAESVIVGPLGVAI